MGEGAETLLNDRALLWTTIDPRGFSVSLAIDVWQHIQTEHTDLEPHAEAIRSTVESPDEIYFDAASTAKRKMGSQVYAYYKGRILTGELKDTLVYVSVKFVQEPERLHGYVQTALATRAVQKRMKLIWKK